MNRSTVFVTSKAGSMGDNTITPGPHKRFIRLKHPSGSEDVHYSIVYEGFPEEFELMAERDLKETEEGRKRGVKRLKEFMAGEGLPPMKDDLLLLAVLRNCKYDMKKSEVKLKNFLKTRREIITMLKDIEMEKIERIVDDMGFGMLPYRDKHGRVILYTRPMGCNLEHYEVPDLGLVFLAALLFVMSFPITSTSGFVYCGDCKSDSLSIFCQIFGTIKKYLFPLLSIPLRVSRVEVLNENYLCRGFMKIMKPFLSKKLVSRVSFHGSNFEQFHEMYNPDILPEDFGGNMGQFSNEAYKQKFLEFIRDLVKEKL